MGGLDKYNEQLKMEIDKDMITNIDVRAFVKTKFIESGKQLAAWHDALSSVEPAILKTFEQEFLNI